MTLISSGIPPSAFINSNVTAGGADATDGFELDAGESLLIEGRNANEIYVIASVANQRVSYLVI